MTKITPLESVSPSVPEIGLTWSYCFFLPAWRSIARKVCLVLGSSGPVSWFSTISSRRCTSVTADRPASFRPISTHERNRLRRGARRGERRVARDAARRVLPRLHWFRPRDVQLSDGRRTGHEGVVSHCESAARGVECRWDALGRWL